MPHWSQKYVGLPYIEGEFDCAFLAEKVRREVFGHDLQLPKERDYCGFVGPDKFRQMTRAIQMHMQNFVKPVQTPKDGDGVLIKTRGYLQHIGIYCNINGEGWVLHGADMKAGAQVVLQRVRDMPTKGLQIEGYYEWI